MKLTKPPSPPEVETDGLKLKLRHAFIEGVAYTSSGIQKMIVDCDDEELKAYLNSHIAWMDEHQRWVEGHPLCEDPAAQLVGLFGKTVPANWFYTHWLTVEDDGFRCTDSLSRMYRRVVEHCSEAQCRKSAAAIVSLYERSKSWKRRASTRLRSKSSHRGQLVQRDWHGTGI